MVGPQPPALSTVDGDALVGLAVEAIRHHLDPGRTAVATATEPAPPAGPALLRPGCSFVTIMNSAHLRGCIGSLKPIQPLYRDVVRNARRATADPRMAPVSIGEWPYLSISVCVLGDLNPLPVRDMSELYRQLRPNQDGLVIGVGAREVTFLPSVWAKLTDPAEFVSALLAKGGWRPDRLPRGAHLYRYATAEFHATTDPGPVAPGPALTGLS